MEKATVNQLEVLHIVKDIFYSYLDWLDTKEKLELDFEDDNDDAITTVQFLMNKYLFPCEDEVLQEMQDFAEFLATGEYVSFLQYILEKIHIFHDKSCHSWLLKMLQTDGINSALKYMIESSDEDENESSTFCTLEDAEEIIRKDIFGYSDFTREEAIGFAHTCNFDEHKLKAVIQRLEDASNEELEMFKTGERKPVAKHWLDTRTFEDNVENVISQIISMSPLQTRRTAISISKDLLDDAIDKEDQKLIEVHERAYYELRIATDKAFETLKKAIFS